MALSQNSYELALDNDTSILVYMNDLQIVRRVDEIN
jgi:hypothetical protein